MAPLFTTGQDDGLQGQQTTQHVTQPSAGMLTGKTCHRGCRKLKSRHVVAGHFDMPARSSDSGQSRVQIPTEAYASRPLNTMALCSGQTTRTRATRPTAQNRCDGELRVTSTVEPLKTCKDQFLVQPNLLAILCDAIRLKLVLIQLACLFGSVLGQGGRARQHEHILSEIFKHPKLPILEPHLIYRCSALLHVWPCTCMAECMLAQAVPNF